ncbi:indolepyruvate ferredoxin oxidoreductase subunit alpha [Streptomyces sp. NBC_01803]|uniref:indolepyruvate ferredoxin oxidoreductase subunit alpha n=1 Tax=Streptomyces sp. NBC_01803 TaxID=2975946 RepID=UPI002DD80B3F|nr:4Fe-4S binding protein [Streptomyces sp. NBC_01803]WSA45036.1 4Fe-4S binding protein [Streptomyces sp. NBC_01803]
MSYVIGGACVDVHDMSCVEECPVDAIYRGDRKLYIQPDECIDCGLCQSACPVGAISDAHAVPDQDLPHVADARRFFYEPLPGRAEPLGSPEGAQHTGPAGVDTALVTVLPPNA